MAKVSIVIPVYNVEQYICKCLDSVINQTLKDIEIICVDDGSTDSCPQILDAYAASDERVKVIHKENRGYGHSMNMGMDIAQGEYFAILESDDMVDSRMYEELYSIAKGFDLDIIKADFCRFVENNGVLEESNQKIAHNGMYNRIIPIDNEWRAVVQNASLYTWSGIYKMEFLRQNHIRHNETPGASYQDNGFWFLTISFAKTIYFYDKVFYKLRRDNPNSSFFSKEKVYCIRDEYDYILEFLKNNSPKLEQILPYYWWARLGAYIFNYFRIAPEFREDFLLHFREILEDAKPYLNENLYTKKNWKIINSIYENATPDNRMLQNEPTRKFENSSFIKRFLWCCEDHGLIYTIQYSFRKIFKKSSKNPYSNLVTKDEIKRLATKDDINRLERQINDRINRVIAEMKIINLSSNTKNSEHNKS